MVCLTHLCSQPASSMVTVLWSGVHTCRNLHQIWTLTRRSRLPQGSSQRKRRLCRSLPKSRTLVCWRRPVCKSRAASLHRLLSQEEQDSAGSQSPLENKGRDIAEDTVGLNVTSEAPGCIYRWRWCWWCCCTRRAPTDTSTRRCLMGRCCRWCRTSYQTTPSRARRAQRSGSRCFSSGSTCPSFLVRYRSDWPGRTRRTAVCSDGSSTWPLQGRTGRYEVNRSFRGKRSCYVLHVWP